MIPNLHEHLCFKLYVASRLITQGYGKALAELDLTYPKYLVLATLGDHDKLTVSEIGEKLFLDSGTLSPLLKSLESLGYVKRERSADDDRIVINCLTTKGRSAHKKASKAVVDLYLALDLNPKKAEVLQEAVDDFILRSQRVIADGITK